MLMCIIRAFPILLICTWLFPGSYTYAELVTGVAIHDVSSELPAFNRLAPFVVDSSGLTGNVHSTDPGGTMWLNAGNGFFNGGNADPTNPGGVGAVISFNLGGQFDLSEMRVWNYNEQSRSGNFFNRGARSVSVFAAPDLTSPLQHVGDYEFLRATGAGYVGDVYSLNISDVQLVEFRISSNHNNNQAADALLVGLAEVQFFSSVPEPSAAAFLLVGAAGYLLRNRRRRS